MPGRRALAYPNLKGLIDYQRGDLAVVPMHNGLQVFEFTSTVGREARFLFRETAGSKNRDSFGGSVNWADMHSCLALCNARPLVLTTVDAELAVLKEVYARIRPWPGGAFALRRPEVVEDRSG